MKLLNFLLICDNHSLSRAISDYLIESGHGVVLAMNDSADVQYFKERNKQVCFIDVSEVTKETADYAIYFVDKLPIDSIPIQCVEIYYSDNTQFEIETILSFQNKMRRLKTNYLSKRVGHANLFDNVVDLFIDSIIHLSREGHTALSFVPETDCSHFIQLHFKGEAIQVNNSLTGKRFNFQDLRPSSNMHYSNREVVISIKEFLCSQGDLEFLVLWILFQLNGRTEASYNYCVNENSYRSIQLNYGLSYQDICFQFANREECLIEDDLIKNTVPQILFSNNFSEDSISSRLTFECLLDCTMLKVSYPDNLHFFDSLERLVSEFFPGYLKFKTEELLWQEFSLRYKNIHDDLPSIYSTSDINTISDSIDKRFESVVESHGDRIALHYNERILTYRELNERSNQFSCFLESCVELSAKKRVLICLERSEQYIIAILASFKLGCAYIPVSTTSSRERIAFLIEDASPDFVITDNENIEQFKNTVLTINIDIVNANGCSVENRVSEGSSSELAYIVYTSGSTGKPKGVLVNHLPVINMINSQVKYFGLLAKEVKRCLWFSECSFDAHISEIFTCLLTGNALHIIPNKDRSNLKKVARYIDSNLIDVATIPPAILDMQTMLALETLVVAGETANKSILDCYQSQKTKVIIAYGPTEASVCTTLCFYEHNPFIVGGCIENAKIFILDENKKELPDGVIGDIYISGVGLAEGYTDKLVTDLYFINVSIGSKKHRVFKPGDRGRINRGEKLEFFGRNDRQVKLRGFRIELDEIDVNLSKYPGVSQAYSVLTENKALFTYYVSDEIIKSSDLSAFLLSKLPEYMVPANYFFVNEIPVNINGKVDIKSLESFSDNAQKEILPSNSVESQLCAIWADVFKDERLLRNVSLDFYREGGDSIKSIQIANKIKEQMRLDVSIKDVLTYRTVRDLSDKISSAATQKGSSEKELKVTLNRLPLKGLQKGLAYHYLSQGLNDDAYIVQVVLEYQSDVSVSLLMDAWRYAIKIYPALRTKYNLTDNTFSIYEGAGDKDHIKLLMSDGPEKDLTYLIRKDRESPYNLSEECPFRVYIVESPRGKYYSIFSHHHILLDGWSNKILVESVHDIYASFLKGCEPSIKYDQAFSQSYIYYDQYLNADKSFWDLKLNKGFTDISPIDLLKDEVKKVNLNIYQYSLVKDMQEVGVKFSSKLMCKLLEYSKQNGFTLNAIIQFAWHVVLSTFSRSGTTVVGTTVSGRYAPVRDIDKSVGSFINTLPLVVDHAVFSAKSIRNCIGEMQKLIVEINDHQHIDLTQYSNNGNRFFYSLFVFENDSITFDGYKNESVQFSLKEIVEKSDFPLGIIVKHHLDSIQFNIQYAAELFSTSKIKAALLLLENVLFQVFGNDRILYHEISLLSQEEKKKLSLEVNNTKVDPLIEGGFVSCFESQAEIYPNRIAIESAVNGRSYSYLALNTIVNKFSRYLRSLGVKEGEKVVVYFESSVDAIIAILSILKLGSAYVPVDPESPKKRVQQILQETKAAVVISLSLHSEELAWFDGENCCFDRIITEVESNSGENLGAFIDRNSIAYVIYTSGSTGRPKGVCVQHKSMMNYLDFACETYISSEYKSVPLHSSICFDMSVTSIFSPLMTGNALIIYEPVDGQEHYENLLRNLNNFHFVKLTPTHLKLFYESIHEADLSMDNVVTKFVIGGENLLPELVKEWQLIAQGIQYFNEYGPTEATVACSVYKIPDYTSSALPNNVPIGRPVKNTRIYILNDSSQPVPFGVSGEICIAGEGVAKGYLNNVSLTEARFISLPLLDETHAKIYKTGDVGYFDDKLILNCMGRNDRQIKRLGYRVELGEIENVLRSHEDIGDSVVLFDSKTDALVAYIVQSEFDLYVAEVKAFLSKLLPTYMMPSQYFIIDTLPVTNNGKVDYESLKRLSENVAEATPVSLGEFTAPQRKMKIIWEDVLKQSNLSVNDNFFAIGGHSLLATKLISQVRAKYNVRLSIRSIFENPTIESLTKVAEDLMA